MVSPPSAFAASPMTSRSRSAARTRILSARKSSRPTATTSDISQHASTMSASRSSSPGSQGDGLGPDVLIAWLERTGRHHVDRATEQSAQLILQMEEIEQGAVGLEVDEEIYITACGLVSTSNGAEQRHRTASMTPDDVEDLLTPLIQSAAQRSHTPSVRRAPCGRLPAIARRDPLRCSRGRAVVPKLCPAGQRSDLQAPTFHRL